MIDSRRSNGFPNPFSPIQRAYFHKELALFDNVAVDFEPNASLKEDEMSLSKTIRPLWLIKEDPNVVKCGSAKTRLRNFIRASHRSWSSLSTSWAILSLRRANSVKSFPSTVVVRGNKLMASLAPTSDIWLCIGTHCTPPKMKSNPLTSQGIKMSVLRWNNLSSAKGVSESKSPSWRAWSSMEPICLCKAWRRASSSWSSTNPGESCICDVDGRLCCDCTRFHKSGNGIRTEKELLAQCHVHADQQSLWSIQQSFGQKSWKPEQPHQRLNHDQQSEQSLAHSGQTSVIPPLGLSRVDRWTSLSRCQRWLQEAQKAYQSASFQDPKDYSPWTPDSKHDWEASTHLPPLNPKHSKSKGIKTGEFMNSVDLCVSNNALQSGRMFHRKKLEAMQFENKGFANAKAKEP